MRTPLVSYEPGAEYAVVLSGGAFLGFQVWASSGMISASADGLSQTACVGTRITHLGKDDKAEAWGFWTAPPVGSGDVSLHAAVVIDYDTFTVVSSVIGEHSAAQIERRPDIAVPVAFDAATTPVPQGGLPASVSFVSTGAIAYAHVITLSPELLVEWQYAPPSVYFRVNSSMGGWASLSLNAIAAMIGGDAVLIQPQLAAVTQVYIAGKTAAGVVAVPADQATLASPRFSSTPSGGWTASWSRPLSAGTYVNAQSISVQATVLTAAWGAPVDGLLAYHGPRVAAVDVFFATGASSSVSFQVNSGLLAHGALMFASFGVLLPLGAFIARWGKHGGKAGAWFRTHRSIQTVACILLAAGLACAIQAVGNSDVSRHFVSAHARLGFALAVYALLQPLNALVRPHVASDGDSKSFARRVWEGVHKGGGWAALALLAPATLILGLAKLAPALLPIYYAVVGASALAAVACMVRAGRTISTPRGPPNIVVATVSPTASNGATKQ